MSGGAERQAVLETPIGRLKIAARGGNIVRIAPTEEPVSASAEDALLRQCAAELEEYFAGTRREFRFSVEPDGTEFQRGIWAELRRIPYGETASYREVAERACGDGRRFARAAAAAAHRNPILLAIPCHRMIGADGSLMGYAPGAEIKRFLLNLETE